MANIGTTIAPWMVFFQQSSVVDKRMQEKDIPWGRVDTAVGAVFTVVVAIFCIILAGQLLHGQTVDSAAQAAQTLQRSGDTARHYVGTFLAIGLFDAGLLGAICISLATSWAVGEVFGWAHSLNNKIREAPWFYAVYALALVTAATVVLVSSAKVLVTITLFVQVIAVTLLPAALVFLLLLLNDEKAMGKFKNTLFQNIVGFTIVIAICILSTLYAVSALFPSVFK
jgi:Mn2+/Fe2+ NRAMP family transporter